MLSDRGRRGPLGSRGPLRLGGLRAPLGATPLPGPFRRGPGLAAVDAGCFSEGTGAHTCEALPFGLTAVPGDAIAVPRPHVDSVPS